MSLIRLIFADLNIYFTGLIISLSDEEFGSDWKSLLTIIMINFALNTLLFFISLRTVSTKKPGFH